MQGLPEAKVLHTVQCAGSPVHTGTQWVTAAARTELHVHHGEGQHVDLHICQGVTTLRGKSFFLKSHLNLSSIKSFPLVLSIQALVKSP